MVLALLLIIVIDSSIFYVFIELNFGKQWTSGKLAISGVIDANTRQN